ncbi:hypothetical protein EKO04_003390 [Ascochyta lentis]|uniref:Uncharacterized protein n=1 Tax=Ascochyta lentis TaxID=205686 RepID=A0A8H7J9W0_9PLEO|nr:hypothetical protein EKO04_003390 [Ascochyta lentis]
MHSLGRLTALRWLVVGFGAQCVLGAVVPSPTITPAPIIERQDPNAIELAKVLLTALPASLRQLAATNLPAVSTLLWHEFLDDNKPEWFKDLPQNIQSYLIVQYGPSTAWPTASATSSASSASSTASSSGSSPVAASATSSSTDSPPASHSGLTEGQKIGIGIGVPLGFLALAAVLIPLCFACRKKKKKTSGYEPPPSPGFMPHGAFQEKSTSYQEYRRPLNHPALNRSQSWDHDDELWMPEESQHRAHNGAPAAPMGNSTTVIGPALVHTHSSNRARGKRTSHNSLHSVAEVTEPDEGYVAYSPHKRMVRRSSMPLRPQDLPPIPASTNIRRKPISQVESPVTSPAADRASGHFSLLRPAILHQDHSGSSSSNLAPTLSSPEDSRRSSDITDATSPGSPLSSSPNHVNQNHPANPFSNDYAYVEDYGPEYQHGYANANDGLFGGHRSLEAYPPPPEKSERRSSKTDWPLKDWPLKSLGSRRNRERSPQWDRIYER